MEKSESGDACTARKLLRTARKGLPLFAVVLISLLIIWPLSLKIEARKESIAQRQAAAVSDKKAAVNVVTMAVEPGLLQEKISLPGVVKPWISLDVVSEVTGKVVHKEVTEGSRVEKGDVLAVIDKSDYRNARDSALASWETALANGKRLNALSGKQFVTRVQLDEAVARVKTTRAALDNARLNLSRCTIVSPMKGVVDRVHVETGKFLNAGDPVARVLQMDRLKVSVGIPESDVEAVRKVETFDVTIDVLDGRTFAGTRHYLYKTAESAARLYTLEIEVSNDRGEILPDMFARVAIVKNTAPQGLAVPMYSLVNRGENVGVYVETAGIARFRPVETGFRIGWKTLVREGLSAGEKVVVAGHRLIEDGAPVKVTRTVRDMAEMRQ